jgi:hypothetical protein
MRLLIIQISPTSCHSSLFDSNILSTRVNEIIFKTVIIDIPGVSDKWGFREQASFRT